MSHVATRQSFPNFGWQFLLLFLMWLTPFISGVTNKSHSLLSRKRLWDSRWLLLKILCRAPLRLAKLTVDEAYLGRGEGATAQLAQVAERRVDGDPLAELVPRSLGTEAGKVHLGEFRAPKCSGFRFLLFVHICCFSCSSCLSCLLSFQLQRYKIKLTKTNKNKI